LICSTPQGKAARSPLYKLGKCSVVIHIAMAIRRNPQTQYDVNTNGIKRVPGAEEFNDEFAPLDLVSQAEWPFVDCPFARMDWVAQKEELSACLAYQLSARFRG